MTSRTVKQTDTVIPCPVLIGRAAELQALSEALDAAGAGRGGLVFVNGEAGIGKSRLVSEVSSVAARRHVRVFRGRAVPGSGGTAFRPLTEALAPLVVGGGTHGDDLAPWLPALSAIVPTLAPAAAGVEFTAPVRGEAVVRLLRSVCAPGAGLLVLEDLHWADPETLEVVEHLSDNLERTPVLCVATVRSEEASLARDLVRRAASRRTTPVLTLVRLNKAQVSAMVHSCTGGTDRQAVERIVSLADGVPFLVEEMLMFPGLPESLADAVQSRLAGLPEDDRRVLVTAAAAGPQFDWRWLGPATGLAEAEVADALDRGVAAQLLAIDGDDFKFRHVLTAEAVFASVTPPRRQAFASSALAALDATGTELPAQHWEVAARLAERAGRPDRAGRLHLACGEEALRRGAVHSAALALERAVRLSPAGESRDAAAERLVHALVAVGRIDDALATGQRLAGRLPAAKAASIHLRLAGGAATASRWEPAAEQLAAARALLDNEDSPALWAELAVREAELALGTNAAADAERSGRAALDLARQHALPDLECEALQLLGRCARRSSLDAAQAWFQQALDAAQTHQLPVWRLRALHELGTIALLGRFDVNGLIEAHRLAEELGAMATAAILDIEIAAGCFGVDDNGDTARRHGLRAAHRATELGMNLVAAYGWLHVSGAAMLAGDREQAEAAAAQARSAAPGNRDIDGLLTALEVLGAMLADDVRHALDLAERSSELMRGSQTVPPAQTRAAWPVLLALAGRGEAEAAIEEIERAGVGVNQAGLGWLTLAKAIVAGRSDPQRAAVLAVEADDHLKNVPSALWRSLARRLAAGAAASDAWAFPAQWLAEAEGWLRTHGYPAVAAACRALRGDAEAGIPAAWIRAGISRREVDVLKLVIEGLSNREIADRLYLSVRTVEKHVEALLRKTGARSRTQLARFATT